MTNLTPKAIPVPNLWMIILKDFQSLKVSVWYSFIHFGDADKSDVGVEVGVTSRPTYSKFIQNTSTQNSLSLYRLI